MTKNELETPKSKESIFFTASTIIENSEVMVTENKGSYIPTIEHYYG